MTVSYPGSVTEWIAELKADNSADAAQKLWERFFRRLNGLARELLHSVAPQCADDEQVALDAFFNLLRGVESGRFPDLNDRRDLWQILVDLVQKRANDRKRHLGRKKRDWKRTVGESAIGPLSSGESNAEVGIVLVQDDEPTPDLVVSAAAELHRLFAALDDVDATGELRVVATMKFQAYTNKEIATRLTCSERTVERVLARIRTVLDSNS